MDDDDDGNDGDGNADTEETNNSNSKSNLASSPTSPAAVAPATSPKQAIGSSSGSRPRKHSLPLQQHQHLPPSGEWYHLLIGILTRAALQGYLTAGWRGVDAVECLLGVGIGVTANPDRKEEVDMSPSNLPSYFHSHSPASPKPNTNRSSPVHTPANPNADVDAESEQSRSPSPEPSEIDPSVDPTTLDPDTIDVHQDDNLFKKFDPDELPGMKEAVGVLFPSLAGKNPTAAEAEFGKEMRERLRKVRLFVFFFFVLNLNGILSLLFLITHTPYIVHHYPCFHSGSFHAHGRPCV